MVISIMRVKKTKILVFNIRNYKNLLTHKLPINSKFTKLNYIHFLIYSDIRFSVFFLQP